ncbi:hypothetical protein [Methylobacterium sp. Leaf99]|uniref:hypothetical protein n=1 Tax=Methylobacterium sp. Leaf99 TaxID=1736251 RepID=UPI0012EE3ECD|nr:hypothetical protein [Methylobacterium sp. Leaf99]
MNDSITDIVKNLVAVEANLSSMNTSDRMAVGELLGAALRESGALERMSSQHQEPFLQYEVKAGALGITIHASHGNLYSPASFTGEASADLLDSVFEAG